MVEKQDKRNLLFVEDNPADARLLFEAIRESGRIEENSVTHLTDGKMALDFLNRNGDFTDSLRPDLIVLDLNLPLFSGKEVLSFIKNNQELKHIPVIILSSSLSHVDISFSYKNHANCYIKKPVGFEEFFEIVRSIENFWFETTTLL